MTIKNLKGKPFRYVFPYMSRPWDSVRKSKNKGLYDYYEWNGFEHHEDGKFKDEPSFNPGFAPVDGKFGSRMKDIIRRVMRRHGYSEDQLKLLFKKEHQILDDLLDLWQSNYDIAIYDDPLYAFETIHCGVHVTGRITNGKRQMTECSTVRHVLCWLRHNGIVPKTILDVGPGIGISSIFLALEFPDSTIYVDEANPLSVDIIKEFCKELSISNVVFGDILPKYDFICMLEVIEHIQSEDDKMMGDPTQWLKERLDKTTLWCYSTYWRRIDSVGHFPKYRFNGHIETNPKKFKPEFHKMVTGWGWYCNDQYAYRNDNYLKFYQMPLPLQVQ